MSDPMRAFVEQVARFTTYQPGSTDDFQDAMDTCNRLIVDARKLLGWSEDDEDPEDVTLPGDIEEGPACPECDEVLELDMHGTCCSCGFKPCKAHRDTGRGVCADCGVAI